jgi:CRISPR-associated endoribonuclease Cas6
MLTSLVLQVEARNSGGLPASLGRAAQALLLRLVREQDAVLAATLHADNAQRPYTVSDPVLGRRQAAGRTVQPGDTGWLRFTGLTEDVSGCLTRLTAQPPAEIDLDGFPLQVVAATLDATAHAWASQTDYRTLAARYLLDDTPQIAPRVEMYFASPTTFRSSGRYVPLPLPELVFGSLLDRWQAFAPVALSPEVRRFAAAAVVVTRYALHSQCVRGKEDVMHIGFTGRVAFTALNRDRYWLSVLNLLAAYAFYSGVGYGTATGMGQVRSVQRRGVDGLPGGQRG